MIALRPTMLSKVSLITHYIIITHFCAYLDNTIRVMQWYKSQSEDKCLMECLEIVQQLSGTKDVTRDLQYIIDMKAKYRQ
jgi:hypothetical protein